MAKKKTPPAEKKKPVPVVKKKQPNVEADIKNKNKGTSGTNITYDKAQGDRSKQLEANKKKK